MLLNEGKKIPTFAFLSWVEDDSDNRTLIKFCPLQKVTNTGHKWQYQILAGNNLNRADADKAIGLDTANYEINNNISVSVDHIDNTIATSCRVWIWRFHVPKPKS